MEAHSLRVLEYPVLLDDIAARTQSALGRARIEALTPLHDLQDISGRRGLAEDALALLESGGVPPGLAVEDVSDVLRRAAPRDAVLGGDDLVRCRANLEGAAAACGFLLADEQRRFTHLRQVAARLTPCGDLQDRLQRALDHDGNVQDAASPELRHLRRQAATLERRITKALEGMLNSSDNEAVVQEKFVTVRNGRFVIPIRREEKSRLTGVVHDHSNSGRTLFVEPTGTLPLGNELAGVRLEERDEVRRILADLSARVREHAAEIAENQDALAQLDAAVAIGRWGLAYDAVMPVFGRALRLVRARHPLLQRQLRQEGRENELVPLDLDLAARIRTLVITGSNTGGKTVALKTIGLLTLAAQSGLPVPVAEGTEFELFETVFADIGDEQSLQHSLSTFSAHMAHITEIMRGVATGARSLVLLDELGAGTDPLEGGALGCAILGTLADSNTLTVATSHLGVIKNFVHDQKRMTNAAVRFNTDTLAPEYVLDVGRPGASHALLIARRLNVPERVLKTAEEMLSSDHMRLEQVLAQMEEDQRRLAAREEEARGAREDLLRDRDALRSELAELRQERRRLMHDAYRQAEGIVANARRDMEHQIRALKHAGRTADAAAAVDRARAAVTKRQHGLRRGREETAPKPAAPIGAKDLVPGRRVWVAGVRSHGTIESLSGNHVTVDVDGMSFTVDADDLEHPRDNDVERAREEPVVKVTRPRVEGRAPTEINLLGKRVDEAVDLLDQFLDQAVLANLETVRVVHGFGTDRLRRGVHAWLRQCPRVAGFKLGKQGEDPGGAGATVVTLK